MKTIIIVDLEATCDDQGRVSRSSMEIIEIGAVRTALPTFDIIDKKQLYIKPVVHPTLTAFCTSLTGIEQETVDAAGQFWQVCETFKNWLGDRNDIAAWASWGAYDKNQMQQDCTRHGVENPLADLHHINLKTAFAEALAVRRKGMANAFKYLGAEMIGRHHSGVDDAMNMARLLTLSPKFGAHISRAAAHNRKN